MRISDWSSDVCSSDLFAACGAAIRKIRIMFTGIVAAVGQIIEVLTSDNGQPDAGVHLKITAPGFLRDSTKLGDSIAIQGACMTVVELSGDTFSVDVSRESLNSTTGMDTFGAVNLEQIGRANV